MFILTAKTSDGSVITLSRGLDKEKLRESRKATKYFCIQCGGVVRLKVGEIVIPHFAHEKEESCATLFSEGESQMHLDGKIQLYEFFQEKVENVVLEPFLKLLSQRPDLLVTRQSVQYPIEFQCSTIPIEKVESRTRGYTSAGMKPIWIVHTPKQLSMLPQGVGTFQLSKFNESFFKQTSPEGLSFLTYNPQSEQFHYFSSLVHIAGKQYVGLHRKLPIALQTFPFARPNIPTNDELHLYVKAFLKSRLKFLQTRVLVNRRGINDPFLRSCYELRLVPAELPLWIGVPVPFSNAFREHICEWQMQLVLFLRRNEIGVKGLTKNHIRRFVFRNENISDDQVKACLAYRDLLITIGVESPYKMVSFGEEKIVRLFAERFLAKQLKY
ncbi:competence protein CoiA [Sporosarcina sp. CAU 1771]